jgi:hypothetical protein
MDSKKNWETIISAMRNDGVNIPPLVDTNLLTRYLMHCFSITQRDAQILIDEADRLSKNVHRQIGDSKTLFQQKYESVANSIIKSNNLHSITPGAVHITVGISFLLLCNYYSAGKYIFSSMVDRIRLTGTFKEAIEGLYKLI